MSGRPWRMSRRALLMAPLALGAYGGIGKEGPIPAMAAEPTLPADATLRRFDFEVGGLDGWFPVAGQWGIEEMPDAPSGRRVLVQRASKNEFDVIVAPAGPYSDVDVAVTFKPISGTEDASGGIVFRFGDGRYYVVRANAREGNFRLYYYDRGRRQIASASATAPGLGHWHTLRVLAVGDRIHAWLDGTVHLERRHSTLVAGRIGLWTKADSITAFDDLVIRGVVATR